MAHHALASRQPHSPVPPGHDRGLGQGCVVGAYVIDELLGKGGMGEVYRARDRRLDRTVAIKFVSAEKSGDAGAAERLAHEARVNSALNHSGIVTVYDIGRYRGRPFIVMEFVDGEPLSVRLKKGPFNVAETLRLGAQLAEALAAAHVEGVVHRDLKPQNIMLTADGRAKIVDFGLGVLQREPRRHVVPTSATETMRLPVQGTVGYMSPEQASGIPPDLRADQFALGAILYEMVSGQRAFARSTDVQTLSDIIEAEPVPLAELCPAAPPALTKIVNRCLQKRPRDRYASTLDLAHDLKDAADAVASRPHARAKGRFLAIADLWRALVVALAAAAIVLLAGWQRFDDPSMASMLAAQDAVRQVVILPLSVSPGPGDRALADGLVETITNRLARVSRFQRRLRVVPAAEVRREGIANAADVRTMLGAALAISGSLHREGEALRLTFNLIDSERAIQLASCTIDLSTQEQQQRLQEMATSAVMSLLDLRLEPSGFVEAPGL